MIIAVTSAVLLCAKRCSKQLPFIKLLNSYNNCEVGTIIFML